MTFADSVEQGPKFHFLQIGQGLLLKSTFEFFCDEFVIFQKVHLDLLLNCKRKNKSLKLF